MHTFNEILKKFLEIIVIALFVAIIVLTTLQILTRYFRVAVFPWTEEVTRLVLIWASYFAISLVISKKDHININFIFDKFPEKLKKYDLLLIDVLFLSFCLVGIIWGWRVSAVGWTDHNTALKYPRSLFFLPIPVSCFFSLFFIVPDLIKSIAGINKGRKDGEN